jgi:hypothetical protein
VISGNRDRAKKEDEESFHFRDGRDCLGFIYFLAPYFFLPIGRFMKSIFITATMIAMFAFADQARASGDLSSKLDELASRLAILEKENVLLKNRVKELESQAEKSATERLAEIMPKEESERKSFFQKFRTELQSDRDRAKGPWTTPDSWSSVRKRMPLFELRKVLGNPTRIKQSVNPGIDQVYLYEGDLDADGKIESGYVNIKDKRITSFKSPH